MKFIQTELPQRSGATPMFPGFFDIPELGDDPKAYRVMVDDGDGCLQCVGVVVGSKKYGKAGWEAWAPAGLVMISRGFGTRYRAACALVKLAEAMNAIGEPS